MKPFMTVLASIAGCVLLFILASIRYFPMFLIFIVASHFIVKCW